MFQAIRNKIRLYNRTRKSAWRGESELLLVPHLLNRGTAIDVGANKGVYSLAMSRHADRVIAIEPNTDLRRHLDALPANCSVIFSAVGATAGRETLYIPIAESGRNRPNIASLDATTLDTAHVEQRTVEVRTLNEIAGTLDNIQLIKIDVEGTELDVLRGATDILAGHRPALIVECLSETQEASITEFLSGFGYRPFRYAGRRLQPAAQVAGINRDIERNVLYFPCA